MKKVKYIDEITAASQRFSLDKALVAAIIYVESSFSPTALRYERNYKWIYRADHYARMWKVSTDTEIALQKFSYGLMQVMGAVAREQGFDGYLFKLCEPETGIYWGCKYFSVLLKRHGDITKAVASYNAGSPRKDATGNYVNQYYIDKVRRAHQGYMDDANSLTADIATTTHNNSSS